MSKVSVISSQKTLACLIVDDPLLRPRYGFLDYTKLLDEMKTHDFFTEIAFIPWNYRRTDPRTAELFLENPDHFSLCVHGCNHTWNEFGTSDYAHLRELLSSAVWRMQQHVNSTGVPYDPVFIFPQGLFSSVAMRALRDAGFAAAFNTTCAAVDQLDPPLPSECPPFTKRHEDFPLFIRRYPDQILAFEDDVEHGQPVIIVAHHTVFKEGYGLITDLVDRLNGTGKVEWCSLARIAECYSGNSSCPEVPSERPALDPLWSRSKIASRRLLSDVRDNYVATSPVLTRMVSLARSKRN